MLFVLAAVGLLVGRTSRQTVPLWFVVALSAAGMALVLVGLAVEENGVGPSGPQYTPLNTAGSVVLLVAAVAAGIVLGRAIRKLGVSALASAFSSRVAPGATARVALAVLMIITTGAVFYSGSGDALFRSLPLLVFGPATIGAVLGWLSRAAIPIWLMIALPAFAIACHVVGWGQYNDDGDSGALVGLVVLVPGLLAAGALTAGMAAGASWRVTSSRA